MATILKKARTRRHLCFAAFKLLFVSTKIIYYNCFRSNACGTTKKLENRKIIITGWRHLLFSAR